MAHTHFYFNHLQEGMFNNANVIFRTKFVDGVSQVTRTIGTGLNRPKLLNNSQESAEASQGTFAGEKSSHKSRKRGKENVI
jgi:structural maintenance of chromosome 2